MKEEEGEDFGIFYYATKYGSAHYNMQMSLLLKLKKNMM